MRRLFIMAAMALVGVVAASAQSYVVVDSEKVFKSIAAFNTAEAELERLGQTRQSEIDAGFDQVENMYNSYMQQKAMLSEAARAQQEKAIIDRETALNKRQEEVFGPEGELMKRRTSLMQPIEDRVKKSIADYGARTGALVLDIAQNPTVLYYSPAADRTQEIINLLK